MKDQDTKVFKKLCPLMLKDVEYIIYAKLLSNKIKPMMNYITSKQQKDIY